MKSGKYRVTNSQQNNSLNNHDQSYRNCIFTMFIAFLIFFIIILTIWISKNSLDEDDIKINAEKLKRNEKINMNHIHVNSTEIPEFTSSTSYNNSTLMYSSVTPMTITKKINISVKDFNNRDQSTSDVTTTYDWLTIIHNSTIVQRDNTNRTTYYDYTFTTLPTIKSTKNINASITKDNDNHDTTTATEVTILATDEAYKRDDKVDDVMEKINNNNNKSSVCESGKCKQLTSKILSYMNHSADPCEDFYEYACGGIEADSQISSRDLSEQVLERIKKTLEINTSNEIHSSFIKYFNSCIAYNEHFTYNEKLEQVKKNLENIGSFYTEENWPESDNYSIIITQLIANMILNNSPLLFDIVPDINEMDPQKFILRLGPTISNPNFLHYSIEEESCFESNNNNFISLENPVNIQELKDHYQSCKSNKEKSDNMTSWINNMHNSFLKIKKFITNENFSADVNFQILKNYFLNYPVPENKIREVYIAKDYNIITLGELQSFTNLINWTQIIFKLTGINMTPDVKLQIYFKNQIFYALKTLESSNKSHRVELNNALFGFYATNLYKQIVKNGIHKNSHKQCLAISMKFLPNQSSSRYISSFSKNQLDHFKLLINNVFFELKETLKLKFNHLQWTTNEGREQLLQKLTDIKLSLPDTFIFHNVSQDTMIDNFFINTLNLMKKYREEMYSILKSNPNDPKQLWTYFANPFQTLPQTIYSLNLILLPFGAFDSSIFQYENNFDYLIFSSIGNLLAREIAHFFDTNGMNYWNGTRIDIPFGFIDDDLTKAIYGKFINCQRDILFQEPIEITIPLTNQQIQFKMPPSTLNERLSDVMGIKLAHETLNRLYTSNTTKLLPWLSLNIHQLFYLGYAQAYCTKSRLEDFYVSLYEKSILPSRIRILAVAINNKNISQAWNCPEGSQILPTSSCGVFPDLEYQRDIMGSVQIMMN